MVVKPKRKRSVTIRGRRRLTEVKRRPQVLRLKRLVVVRHGERLDRVFPELFDARRYTRRDANQPAQLPIPGRVFSQYRADPPLTVHGQHLATQLHHSLDEAGIHPSVLLSFPPLRCVETASLLVQNGQRVCVEPALHENWETHGVDPNGAYLSAAQYRAAGYPVDVTYRPVQNGIEVNRAQPEAYFEQFGLSIDALISQMDQLYPGGTVLLVGHSNTLDAVYGHFVGGDMESFNRHGNYVGHFAEEPKYTQAMVLDRSRDGGWQLKEGVIKAYTTGTFTTANPLQEDEDEEEEEEEEEEEDGEDED